MGKSVVLCKNMDGHTYFYAFWTSRKGKYYMAKGEIVDGIKLLRGMLSVDKKFGNECYADCLASGWEKMTRYCG